MLTTRQITSQIKAYIKKNDYKNMIVHSIRGTIHIDNVTTYWTTAKTIAESATGYAFQSYGDGMTRPLLIKDKMVEAKDYYL